MKKIAVLIFIFQSLFVSGQFTYSPYSIADNYPDLKPLTGVEPEDQIDSIMVMRYNEDALTIYNKYLYSYDEMGNRIDAHYLIQETSTLDQTERWSTSYRSQYGFDTKDNLILSMVKVPDEDYVIKTIYSFNQNSQLVSEECTRSFDQINWSEFGSKKYTYLSNGKIESETETNWNSVLKKEYQYDIAGNLILFEKKDAVFENEVTGEWTIDSKTIFKYDEQNNPVLIQYYLTNGISPIYLSCNDEINYSPNGKISSIIQYSFNRDSTEYNRTKEEYQYNQDGNIIQVDQFKLKDSLWAKNNQIKFTYNSSENSKTVEEYRWNNNNWEGLSKYISYFDETGKITEIEIQYWNEKWTPDYKYQYYYHQETLAASIFKESANLTCYPNPTSGLLNFNTDRLKNGKVVIYNAEGKLILNKNLSVTENQINIQNLGTGIYLYEFTSDGKLKTGKIIKK